MLLCGKRSDFKDQEIWKFQQKGYFFMKGKASLKYFGVFVVLFCFFEESG